jgi:hypothetical protein
MYYLPTLVEIPASYTYKPTLEVCTSMQRKYATHDGASFCTQVLVDNSGLFAVPVN